MIVNTIKSEMSEVCIFVKELSEDGADEVRDLRERVDASRDREISL